MKRKGFLASLAGLAAAPVLVLGKIKGKPEPKVIKVWKSTACGWSELGPQYPHVVRGETHDR